MSEWELQLEEAGNELFRCAMCHVWKPASQFHNSRRGKFTYCRDCRNAYDRRYYAERGAARRVRRRAWLDANREWMNSLKAGIPCADCGGMFPPFVMQWDHLLGFEKRAAVATMLAHYPRQVILDELRKCQLVCANCHVLRTVARTRRKPREN